MSYTVNIPFNNISYYQANRQSARVVFDAYSYGSYTHWGSNWDGEKSTVYDVAKIKFDLSSLGLPTKLPNGTVLQFTVKNIRNWIGAGYLRGRVTQVNYETVTECFGAFYPLDNLINASLGYCQSPNIWGNDSEGVTVTFSGTVNSIDTTKPVYLYIYDTVHNFGNPGSTTSYFQEDYMSFKFILPYTSVGQPSQGKMEINGTSITGTTPYEATRDMTINLSWNSAEAGNNNPVSGYKLYYGLSGETYSQSLLIGNITSYNFKISEQFGGPRKGTIFHLGIQALATHENMNSEIVSLGYISIINKAPEPPTFETSGIIQITTGIDTPITVVNLVSSDVDDDPLTFYYAIGNQPNLTTFQNEQILPIDKKINMNPEYCYLYIRAKESETSQNVSMASSWTCVKAIVNEVPSFSFSYEVKSNHEAKARNNQNKKYADTLSNIKCVLSKIPAKITSYEWQIGTEDDRYDIHFNSTTNTISSQKIKAEDAQNSGGKRIKLKLKIKDSAGDSFTSEYLTEHYRLYKIVPDSIKIRPVENTSALVAERYINNFVIGKIDINFEEDDVFRTLSFYRGQKNETGEWIYTLINNKVDVNEAGEKDYGPFETKVQYNQEYRFKIGLSDPFNNTSFIESDSYWRLGLFNVSEGAFSFSKTEWHPLKDYQDNAQEKVQFISLFVDNIGEIGKNSYTIEAIYENKTYLLVSKIENEANEEGWNTIVDGSTITFQINNIDLFKKLKRATNTPQISIVYKITGYNAFGEPGTPATFNGIIITQESPSLQNISASAFIYSDALIEYKNWFNPEDKVVFTLSGQVFDYNDLLIDEQGFETSVKTVNKYIICYKYKNDQEWRLPNKDWTDWQGDFIRDGQYLSEITINSMPSLALNNEQTDIALGIQLLDDTGVAAEGIKENYLILNLIACRKENIVLSIEKANLKDKQLEISLQIGDFGGNSRGFENFCRSGQEYSNIVLYISKDNENFEEYVPQISYSENADNATILNKYLASPMLPYITLKNNEEVGGRLYVKAKLDIITNSYSNNKITSISATYLLYLSEPTMSHRSHWIGINNTENKEEDVFQVSSFEDKKQIRLKGVYKDQNGSAINMEVIINLDNGIISASNGMSIDFRTGEVQNAQIDCGAW